MQHFTFALLCPRNPPRFPVYKEMPVLARNPELPKKTSLLPPESLQIILTYICTSKARTCAIRCFKMNR